MTTATATVKVTSVDVIWSEAEIKLAAGGKVCVIDHAALNTIAIDDDCQEEYNRVKSAGKGQSWFNVSMTKDQMNLWVAMKTVASNPPAAPVNVPSDEMLATLATPSTELSKPEPISAPTVKTSDLPTTIIPPNTTYIGGPTAQVNATPEEKKRKKRGEKMGCWLNEEYRKRTRGWGIDKLEEQITRLQRVVELANQEVSILVYDIPTDIREMIVDPCNILHCIGFRYNKSVWIVPTKALSYGVMERLFGLWDRFTNPDDSDSSNTWDVYNEVAGRLPLVKGKRQFIEYGIEEFSAKSLERLRKMAEKDLRTILVDAHTSMIYAIDKADKDLTEAMKEADKMTLKESEQKVSQRANEIRSALVKAGEIMRRSVAKAIEYDNTENVKDMLFALRDAILSQATTFNAVQKDKGAEGVTV